MSGAAVVALISIGISVGCWLYFTGRLQDLEARIYACRSIRCPQPPAVDRLLSEGTFVVKPAEVCSPVPAGWESWCSGAEGTECTVRFNADGSSIFTITFV
jgi:hypothetical protein